jgi:hypothetical protein
MRKRNVGELLEAPLWMTIVVPNDVTRKGGEGESISDESGRLLSMNDLE